MLKRARGPCVRLSAIQPGAKNTMQQYEIHVVQDDKQRRTYPCLQVNDHAAIRRAQAIAKRSEGLEVWRAAECVYARPAEAAFHGNL